MEFPSEISTKIISSKQAEAKFNTAFRSAETIVFTNGCFDILHKGHIYLLNAAKSFGTKLVVGLNTDASVKILKGNTRPIKDEETRALILASLSFVDFVILFAEETPEKLIETIHPKVLVKGGDYKINEIVGADFVINHGGQVKIIPFLKGHSSSKLIKKKNS